LYCYTVATLLSYYYRYHCITSYGCNVIAIPGLLRRRDAKSASAFALVFFVLIESRYLSSNTRTNGRPRKCATCTPDAYNSDDRDYSRFSIDIACSYIRAYTQAHIHARARAYTHIYTCTCAVLIFLASKQNDFSIYTCEGTHVENTMHACTHSRTYARIHALAHAHTYIQNARFTNSRSTYRKSPLATLSALFISVKGELKKDLTISQTKQINVRHPWSSK